MKFDGQRNACLFRNGFAVLRLGAMKFLKNGGVLEVIRQGCIDVGSPTSNPSRQGRGA